MKRIYLFSLLVWTTASVFSQTKNFIDQPYLETSVRVDTLVTPDRIYLSILITEKDTKGKVSVEELENKMADKLKQLNINLDKQLTLSDLSSNFKKYFLKQQDVLKSKAYSLLVYDALTAGKVMAALEEIEISNVNLEKTEYSKIEELQLSLKSKAVQKARSNAAAMVKPLNQKIGNAIYITDLGSPFFMQGQMAGINVRGMALKSKEEYQPIDIEFEKIKVESEVKVTFKLE
jgi:uncharacterized protein YggE